MPARRPRPPLCPFACPPHHSSTLTVSSPRTSFLSPLFPLHPKFGGADRLYVKSSFCFGPDWSVVQGIDLGITQIAHKSDEGETVVVWNFPLDITFRSFTAFGWPRLCISVYRIDEWGRDVVQGYGQLALPTVPGAQTKYVRIFRPIAKSWFAQATSWVFGSQPEFFDSKFVAQAENRHGTFEEG